MFSGDHEAAALCDDIEARAYADMFDAAPGALKDQLGLRIERVADATLLVAPRIPDSMFNRAIGLGMHRPAQLQDAHDITAVFRKAGSAAWWLHWNPHADPVDMPDQLLELGFTQPARRSWAKMLREAVTPPSISTDLHIGLASDNTQAEQATQAIAQAFGMPPFMTQWLLQIHGRPGWRLYAVCDGAQVVGGGCLFVDGSTAWIGIGGVLPSHRRRGGQGALMARRIADAIGAGCSHVATETGEVMADESNPSLANMYRCGFQKIASRLNFAGPGR